MWENMRTSLKEATEEEIEERKEWITGELLEKIEERRRRMSNNTEKGKREMLSIEK